MTTMQPPPPAWLDAELGGALRANAGLRRELAHWVLNTACQQLANPRRARATHGDQSVGPQCFGSRPASAPAAEPLAHQRSQARLQRALERWMVSRGSALATSPL